MIAPMDYQTKLPKRDYSGEARLKAQKREEETRIEEKNKSIPVFKFQGYGFRMQHHAHVGGVYFEGPLCPRPDSKGEECFSILDSESGSNENLNCKVCGFTGKLPKPIEEFKHLARLKYEGRQRFLESGGKIETLDVPYEAIKEEDKNETREIKIKWSQKDGRNMAVIYFVDRKNNPNGEKAQVFIDFDREEIRHDAVDVKPDKLISGISGKFPNTAVKIGYKK